MITKKDLIDRIHAGSNVNKQTIESVVGDFVAELCAAVAKGEEVRIHGLGTFKVAVRKAHNGRNPRTGESIPVPEKRVPQLKFSRSISQSLNKE